MAALTSPARAGQAGRPLAGAICLYGFYDTPTWIDREPSAPSAPIDLIEAGTVPFFIAHGALDLFVPVVGARRFAERLRLVSRQLVVYAELPGGQHTFDLYHSMRFEAVIDGIEAFTAWVRSAYPSSPVPGGVVGRIGRAGRPAPARLRLPRFPPGDGDQPHHRPPGLDNSRSPVHRGAHGRRLVNTCQAALAATRLGLVALEVPQAGPSGWCRARVANGRGGHHQARPAGRSSPAGRCHAGSSRYQTRPRRR